MAGPQLRPLGVGEILDASLKVCFRHAKPLFLSVLVVIIPVQIIAAIILASTVDDAALLDPFADTSGVDDDDAGAYIAGQLSTVLLTAVSGLLATGACFRAVATAWLGGAPDWRESLRFAARYLGPLILVGLLYGLGVGLGTIACIVPGVYLFVAWAVAYPALLVEDVRGTKALGRSLELVKGRFWPALGLLVVAYLLTGFIQAILGISVALFALVGDSLAFLILVTTLVNVVAYSITTPFQAAVTTLLYFDLRVRNEGLDLEILAGRLGDGTSAPLGGDGPAFMPAPEPYTEAEKAQAPYWPPPPGWKPEPTAPDAPTEPDARPSLEKKPAPEPESGGWLPPRDDDSR